MLLSDVFTWATTFIKRTCRSFMLKRRQLLHSSREPVLSGLASQQSQGMPQHRGAGSPAYRRPLKGDMRPQRSFWHGQ